jgi:hypothetical protein
MTLTAARAAPAPRRDAEQPISTPPGRPAFRFSVCLLVVESANPLSADYREVAAGGAEPDSSVAFVARTGSPWAPDRDTCIAVVAVIVSDYRHADEIVPERQLELMVAPLPLRSIPRPPVCVHVQDPGSAMCRRAKVRNRAPRARVSGRAVQLCTARGPSAPAIFARGSRGLMPSFRPGSGACRSSAA